MKRSNFTFLFLFSLLSFVSMQMTAQSTGSNSCIDKVNITVDANCEFDIDAKVLGYTGSGAKSIYFPASGSGIPFPGVGSLGTMGLTKGPNSYELWTGVHNPAGPNPTGSMVCWGTINLEIKNLPPPMTSYRETDCVWYAAGGAEWPKFTGVAGCYPTLQSSRETVTEMEMGCDSILYVRTIVGDFSVDGKKLQGVLRVDSLKVLPITPADICYPTNWLEVECDFLPASYDLDASDKADHDAISALLSPANLKAYFDKIPGIDGDSLAGPYIKKDRRTYYETVCVPGVDTTYENKLVKLTGKDGLEYWAEVLVQIKTDNPCKTMLRRVTTKVTNDFVVTKVPQLLPKGTTCNINVKCTDWVIEGECEGLPVVMRKWEIINWCDPTKSVIDTIQWIKVKDTKKPELVKPYQDKLVWASVAPWTCAAEYHFKPNVKDWSGWHTEVEVSEGIVTTGADRQTVWIKGIWKTNSPVKVRWRAVDWCDNATDWQEFYIYVKDNVPPVAIAQDQINVTLTGDHATADGVAILPKTSVDAGSHDAGCGPVTTCVLRKSELEDPIYDYYGSPVYVGASQVYHPHGCYVDGIVKVHTGYTNNGKTKTYTEYEFVVCKDYVKFCCEDDYAVTGEYVPVALVVRDNAGAMPSPDPINHPVYYNYSHSWTNVKVENKSGVYVECADAFVTCDASGIYKEGALKQPKAWTLCGEVELDHVDDGEIDACGNGKIVRRWLYDGKVVCIQTLTGIGTSDFDPYSIKWPKHQDGTAWPGVRRECEVVGKDSKGANVYGIVEYDANIAMGDAVECTGDLIGEPVWCNPGCTLIGVSSKDETIEVNGSDYCKKVIRRWTIIDWCTWKPNSTSPGDDANDTDYDEFQPVDDIWLPNEVAANVKKGRPCLDCEKASGTADRVYVRYKKVDRDGYYTYDQVLKVIDNTDPVIDVVDEYPVSVTNGATAKGDDSECYGAGSVTATVSDLCGETELDSEDATWWVEVYYVRANGTLQALKTAAGRGPEFTMGTQTGYPGDVHIIKWQVRDGCGNRATAETEVTFEDTKKPTPVCIQDLSTAIMNDGSVTIWASDYDNGSFDNCGPVLLSFSGEEYVPSVTITCEDLTNGPVVEMSLYVHDAAGNVDFCYITLRVDDNQGACGTGNSGAAILGEVRTAGGDMVESAVVSLNTKDSKNTSVEGKYAFNVNANANYTVAAKKDNDYMNGVSTLDLVLIQKHVLGLQTLDSPYKVISADINSDAKITAIDLVELRKLILGIYAELPNNDSWRFVDAGQTFDDAGSPFPFVESLKVDNAAGNVAGNDFIAAKIGDVSGNAIANSLLAASGRSAGTLSLEVSDASVKAGELVEVAVRANNFADIAGYQFTMDVKGLSFRGVTNGAISVSNDNFGLLDANTITTAWYSANAISSNDVLFTITFEATSDVTLSEALTVTSRVTAAEAYTSGLEKLDVEMTFTKDGSIAAVSGFTLGQNEPNPFDNQTKIGFTLPQSGAATLTVFDVTGKTIKVAKGDYAKGYNEITLKKSDLNATGVLYYQLESGEFTATKKMILID